MPSTDPSWDFGSYSSKDRMLAVARHEYDELFDLVSEPDAWQRPTACAGWQVGDMVGHLVDATEGFLAGLDAARDGREIAPVGFDQMAAEYDRTARAFRDVPRTELLARLRDGTERLFEEFDALAQSGIGELGNVITGRAAVLLAEAGFPADIAPPMLLVGRNMLISTLDVQRLVIPIETEMGNVEIQVALKISGAAARRAA